MIDSKTVTALVTAYGADPTKVGVVMFYLPAGHPDIAQGAVAAQLGQLGSFGPSRAGISGSGVVGYGATAEEAAKALFAAIATDAAASEAAIAIEATDVAVKRAVIDAAVAADATAEAIKA